MFMDMRGILMFIYLEDIAVAYMIMLLHFACMSLLMLFYKLFKLRFFFVLLANTTVCTNCSNGDVNKVTKKWNYYALDIKHFFRYQ